MADREVRPLLLRSIAAHSAPGGLVFVTRSSSGVELSRAEVARDVGATFVHDLVAGAALDAAAIIEAGGGRVEIYDGDDGTPVAIVHVPGPTSG